MDLPVNPMNGVAAGLFPFQVTQKCYQTWMPLTLFRPLMSSGMGSPIRVIHMKDGDGLSNRVPRMTALDYKNPVMGMQDIMAGMQKPQAMSCEVTIDPYTIGAMFNDLPIMRAGTPVDLPSYANDELGRAAERNLSWTMLKAITWDAYGVKDMNAAPGNGLMPSTYRAVAGSGAYAFNAGQTLQQALNASIANLANNSMTLDHISALKNAAIESRNESAIEPAKVSMMNGQQEYSYVMFMSSHAANMLKKTDDYKQLYRISPRQMDGMPNPLNGANYLLTWDGVQLFSCPALNEFELDVGGTGAANTAWGFLMGAGAAALMWNKEPYYGYKIDTFENKSYYKVEMIRGQRSLVYPALTPAAAPASGVEQGIIHSFTRFA